MLESLRNLAKTWVAKILMGLLVFSFAVWGISDFVNTVDPTEIGRAGDTTVSTTEFSRSYDFAQQNFTEQTRRAPSAEENRAIANQVLQSLLGDALQVDAARALGLDLSNEAIARRIRENPDFGGADAFSPARFRDFLERARIGERDFVEREREAAVQEIWVNSLAGGVTAPAAYLEAINRYANQTRTIATFTLADDALDAIPDPSEEQLKAFYDEHKAEFRSPERRTVSVLSLSPEALADPASVGEEAVRAAYDAEGAYGSTEKRTVQQVFLADRAAATAAADRINAGTPLPEVVVSLGQKPEDVDLGSVAKGEIVNDAVADAAFALEKGKASVVDTPFGAALVHVSEIVPGEKLPYDQVAPEIRRSLALDEAIDQVRALETSVLDAVAGGEQVADIASQFKLPVATVTGVDRTGAAADGARPEVPGGGPVLNFAFARQAGEDAGEVREGETIHFVQVDSVEAPADRAYEDVAPEVIAAWTGEEKSTRLKALADEALAALKSGTPPADVAGRYGAAVSTPPAFSRAAPAADLPATVAAAAFEGPVGHAGVVSATGGHVVFVVTAVEEPVFFEDSADLAGIRENLDDGLGNAVVLDAMNAWQAEVGATSNRQLVEAVVTGQPIQR